MNPKLLELIQNGLKNPKTTVLALFALGVGGAGKYMQDSAIEPLGSVLVGVAGLLVFVIGWIAKDPAPAAKPAPAAERPTATPPPADGQPTQTEAPK